MMMVINSRDVTFTWQLPAITERNGMITNYNLNCVNTTTALTRVYPPEGTNGYLLTYSLGLDQTLLIPVEYLQPTVLVEDPQPTSL